MKTKFHMQPYILHFNDFTISTDPDRLDIPRIHGWLTEQAYWAIGRPLETVRRAIEHSLNFGVYQSGQQVAFARVVTDYATFAWVCDVFVDPQFRGHGLGKRLVEAIVTHPELKRLRRLLLATRDAHELYRRYGGFEPLPNPERWMVKLNSD